MRPAVLLAIALSTLACHAASDDPAPASAWHGGPKLPVARFEAYGAPYPGGRLAFVGGITGVFGDIASAQPSRRVDVLDPRTGLWTDGPPLPEDAPKHHLTVAVWQERLYVVGGFDGILGQRAGEPFRPIAQAYVLDAGAWKKLAAPPLARGAATAQAIDGKIYVTGGAPNEGEKPFAALDVYDIAADRWTSATPMPTAREHLASCAVGGKLVVVGGWIGPGQISQTATEVYDPKADRWSTLPPMRVARGGLAATSDGTRCHVVGGEDWALPFPGTFTTHEVLDLAAARWEDAAPMALARHGLGLVSLGGALWAIGGGPSQGNSYTDVVEVLGP